MSQLFNLCTVVEYNTEKAVITDQDKRMMYALKFSENYEK